MVPALNEVLALEGRPALPYERLRVHVSHGSTGLLLRAWGPELAEAERYLQNAEENLDRQQYREARQAALEAKESAQKALQVSEASKEAGGD